jgi:hypothetical protein
VQGSWSSQPTGAPGTQIPAEQTSPEVQAFPSLHGPVLLVNEHAPVPGSQPSSVQGLPSMHAAGVLTQPVAGEQASVVHAFASSQLSDPPGTQRPSEQESPVVQAFPSLHAPELFVWRQPPVSGSQASSVQALPSSQVTAWKVHPACVQTSFVQGLPSGAHITGA